MIAFATGHYPAGARPCETMQVDSSHNSLKHSATAVSIAESIPPTQAVETQVVQAEPAKSPVRRALDLEDTRSPSMHHDAQERFTQTPVHMLGDQARGLTTPCGTPAPSPVQQTPQPPSSSNGNEKDALYWRLYTLFQLVCARLVLRGFHC